MKPRPYSWMHPTLTVRDTGRYGLGVFANDTIPAGELLIACGGFFSWYVAEQIRKNQAAGKNPS